MDFHVPDYFPEEWADHEPSPIPSGVEVPDFFDYAFAFRQWRLSNGKLTSLNGAQWPIGRTMVADCNLYPTAMADFGGKSRNEYAAVSEFHVIYDRREIKDLIDRPLYGTAGDLVRAMERRPVMIGAGMLDKVREAKDGKGLNHHRSREEKVKAHKIEIPVGDCTCGIYATRTLALLKEKAPWQVPPSPHETAFVGIVKLWGVGYEGSMGYRYQYGYPDRLFTTVKGNVELGERYKVPVELIRRYDDLFDRFGHIGR